MPSQIAIRFAHFASRAPVFELSTDPAITIGQLKDMVQERLATEEVCMMREFGKWYAECEVLGRLRSVEISQLDEHAPLSSMAIADLSVVLLDGPLTDNADGVGMALAHSILNFQKDRVQQTHFNEQLSSAVSQVAHEQRRLVQLMIVSEIRSMKENENVARLVLQAIESTAFGQLMTTFGGSVNTKPKKDNSNNDSDSDSDGPLDELKKLMVLRAMLERATK